MASSHLLIIVRHLQPHCTFVNMSLTLGRGMQVVVMAGGANDFMLPALPLAEWRSIYLAFLQNVSFMLTCPSCTWESPC